MTETYSVARDERDLHLCGEKYALCSDRRGILAIVYDRTTADWLLAGLEDAGEKVKPDVGRVFDAPPAPVEHVVQHVVYPVRADLGWGTVEAVLDCLANELHGDCLAVVQAVAGSSVLTAAGGVQAVPVWCLVCRLPAGTAAAAVARLQELLGAPAAAPNPPGGEGTHELRPRRGVS